MTQNDYSDGKGESDEVSVGKIDKDKLLWIDREDHAKQGMARKGDPEHAEASPEHPHVGPTDNSGRMGGGRS